jgi:hypothetical protein
VLDLSDLRARSEDRAPSGPGATPRAGSCTLGAQTADGDTRGEAAATASHLLGRRELALDSHRPVQLEQLGQALPGEETVLSLGGRLHLDAASLPVKTTIMSTSALESSE